jgi:predicted anti-sigma-YlaC factor YlaD
MNCIEIQTLLSLSLDEPVGPSERAAVDEHLAGCTSCARGMVQQVLTVEILRGVGRLEEAETPPPLPESLIQRIVAARAAAAGTQRRREAL